MTDYKTILIILTLAISGTLSLSGQFMGTRIYRGDYSDNRQTSADSLLIEGRVVESLAKKDLTNAFLVPIDSFGNPGDTIKAYTQRLNLGSGNSKTLAFVGFMTGRKDSTYVFEIGCPGYLSQTVTYKVQHLRKREVRREIPLTVLVRAPRQLKELTVVASKVKFYYRGDTLVYNANAFQLAEGSMLDDLFHQLPGFELNSKGEIKINGEKVETLLLNGKNFFKDDNRLMLENLGAYTVDNVQVYRGQTAVEKWIADPNAIKHLTVDVKLKKEYSMGYIVNAQGGGGTKERYLGSLFASWFSNSARFSLVGNINNVADYSGLHRGDDTWKPSQTSSGDTRRQALGLDYNVENNNSRLSANGNIKYSGDRNFTTNDGNGTTYYTDNQVSNYYFNRSQRRNMELSTTNELTLLLDRVNISTGISGNYTRNDSRTSSLSASFSQEQANITQEALETIYGDGSAAELAALINRTRNLSDSDGKSANGDISVTSRYKVPGTSDIVTVILGGNYTSSGSDEWNNYTIDFGDGTKPSDKRRQYIDNSPNHNMSLNGSAMYTARIGKVSLDLTYDYKFSDGKSNSFLYELQQLADMGEYGVLPPDYQSAFSPANSYVSKEWSGTHSFTPQLRYIVKLKKYELSLSVVPKISFASRNLDYWRDNRWYNIRHHSSLRDQFSGNVKIDLHPGAVRSGNRHNFSYSFSMSPMLPSLMSMVDITDESNPLFIRQGNPVLKSAYSYAHSFSWGFGKKVFHNISLLYSYVVNNFTQASVYNMTTGITRTRTENINGNNNISLTDRINWAFGKFAQFKLTAKTSVSRRHSVDLMATNGAEPVKNSADTWNLGEDLSLDWRIKRAHSITLKCNFLNRRTDSNREGFNKINAFHINYGLTGKAKLPCRFELSTNFSLYTRRGYGSKEMNTTDALWNAQATYTSKNRKWLFMVYAYDILHQVSNVHYYVSASGRSASYTNALPRYVMATVQFRFNHQPKSRM